jgi:RecJ-like exonuclease
MKDENGHEYVVRSCPKCDGKGTVDMSLGFWRNLLNWDENNEKNKRVPCDRCRGTGKIRDYE